MALEFRPPSFVQPQDYSYLPNSIDRIFNALAQAQAMKRQQAMLGTQAELQYGFNPYAPGSGPQMQAYQAQQQRMRALAMQKAELEASPEDVYFSPLDPTQIYRVPRGARALPMPSYWFDPNAPQKPASMLPPGAKPLPQQTPAKILDKQTDRDAAFKLYETARDGLMSFLEGSTTGPILGKLPALTAEQQKAEGGVAAMAPVLKQLFRVSGEGVFTDRDQQLLLDMVPTRKDLPEARRAKMANIDAIVKAKLRIGAPEESPSGGAWDSNKEARYQELLRRRGGR